MSKRATLADLSAEQREVIECWGEGLAVLAGAGTGKTTTLTLKCEELLRRNPEARLAAVSFTERSASDLRTKLSERLQPYTQGSPLSRHRVMTIHGLCGSILREFPEEAGFDGDESMLSEIDSQRLWREATQALLMDESLPADVHVAAEQLLASEGRDALLELIVRLRGLASSGALEALSRGVQPRRQALARVARHVVGHYERLKQRRGAIDFSDLEHGADRALASPRVQAYYHAKYDLVLVDEFQDTNPLQARIIARFCRPGFTNLCVVGDPKQSIYRFRDADVSVFEEFCARLPRRLPLTGNFRSCPGIIDFANRVCAPTFAASEMEYQALVPRCAPSAAFEPVVRLRLGEPADLARWIQGEVKRGVPLGDMALLLRKIRGGNQKWIQALTDAGIPIALGSGGFFWEDPRVRELVAALRWWSNPTQALAGATFLRAVWMGVDDATLDAWSAQDATFAAPFWSSAHPVARALAPRRGQPLRPGEFLAALLEIPEFSAALEAELGVPLLGLWHRAEESSTRGLSFTEVIEEFHRAIIEGRREREVPPPADAGQLRVLTLHGAKGLEFPHVILVDLGYKPRAASSPWIYWDREQGLYLGERDDEGNRPSARDRGDEEREWDERERRKELAESKRLFYVALTRAKQRLVLGMPELTEAQLAKIKPDKVDSEDFWREWAMRGARELPEVVVEAASVPAAVPAPVPATRPPLRPALSKLIRPRHAITELTLLSRCARSYVGTFLKPIIDGTRTESANSEDDAGGMSAPELGTRVHAAMELTDPVARGEALRAIERDAGSARFRAEPAIQWAGESPWMKVDPDRTRCELAFEVPAGPESNEILVGSMDRVVTSPVAVIDYKVTRKRKSPAELRETYHVQLELYAWALGQLDPSLRAARGVVVAISPDGVQEVEVEMPAYAALDGRARALTGLAAALVAGEAPAVPTPGEQCRYCAVRADCPVALK